MTAQLHPHGGAPDVHELLNAIAAITGRPYKRSGSAWTMRCPAHDDRNPSLSISLGSDDKILVKCHAGCDTDDVLAAVGWQISDLFTHEAERPVVIPRARPKTSTKSEYLYHDERGALLYRVVITRHPNGDKETRQHAFIPDVEGATDPAQGGWGGTLGTARKVLYRLPQVTRAAVAGAPIYVAEGEKCVEALEKLGLVATTNPGGALKWIDAYTEQLQEASRVVILPDNDDNGRKHAHDVHAKLTAAGIDALIVELPGLPEKGDIYDWIQAGGSRDDFLTIAGQSAASKTPASTAPSLFADTDIEAPPDIRDEAFTPLLRESVDLFQGISEADPVGIAVHLLLGFGAMVGPQPYVLWGASTVHAKNFSVIVGESGRGRKGQAWGAAKLLLTKADSDFFAHHRLSTGLASGEGLIARVHKPRPKDPAETIPETDPRLLAISPEFASILRMADRKGNTLSATLRQAWDGEALGIDTRSEPLHADIHHITHIAHISPKELRAQLTAVDVANGFANRYLFVWVQRDQLIPRPGRIDEAHFNRVGATIRGALQDARTYREVPLTPDAWERWEQIYLDVESRNRPGMSGELTARAAAHIMRLALTIALFESSPTVDPEHLNAAVAFWDHSDAAITRIFGSRIGNPHAEKLLAATQQAGRDGLDGTARHALFSGNLRREEVNQAVETLLRHGLAVIQVEKPSGGRGRPREVLIAREYTSL